MRLVATLWPQSTFPRTASRTTACGRWVPHTIYASCPALTPSLVGPSNSSIFKRSCLSLLMALCHMCRHLHLHRRRQRCMADYPSAPAPLAGGCPVVWGRGPPRLATCTRAPCARSPTAAATAMWHTRCAWFPGCIEGIKWVFMHQWHQDPIRTSCLILLGPLAVSASTSCLSATLRLCGFAWRFMASESGSD